MISTKWWFTFRLFGFFMIDVTGAKKTLLYEFYCICVTVGSGIW